MENTDSNTDSFVIDCDACVQQHTSTCRSCIVTFLCAEETATVVELTAGRARRPVSRW